MIKYPPLDFFGDAILPTQHGSRLSLEFSYPPFSVLNARDGWWQERKREWLALGIQSELGRGEMAATGGSPEPRARSKMGLPSPLVTNGYEPAARKGGKP